MVRRAILCFCAASLALLTSCAVPGAPMPPSLQLPRPVEDLNYARQGRRTVLAWTPPSQTTEHLGLKHSGATYICRSIGHYPVNSCEMVKRLTASDVTKLTDKKREQAVFEDVIPDNLISPTGFATYSIEAFNDRGRSAGLSNQVRVPLVPTLAPPQDLRVSVNAQGPLLEWTAASAPAAPGLTYEYRIMRRLEGVPAFTTIEEMRADAPGPKAFADRSFEWEKKYDYKIEPVTVVTAQGASPVEVPGDDSSVVTALAKDVFPPAQPSGVQAVFSSVGQKAFIDLTWSPNTESDLAGYLVFRREEGSQPVKITPQPVQAPSFRDADVRAGAKYFYSVVAVDLRGNQSHASEEASESVPADNR